MSDHIPEEVVLNIIGTLPEKKKKKKKMPGHITEEVVLNIIGRLPVKKMMQFTTVCKSWNVLIRNFGFNFVESNRLYNSDNLFIARYSDQHQLRYKVFENNQEFQEHIEFHCPIDRGLFAGCEHGLVCIVRRPHELMLWNPILKIVLELPKPIVRNDYVNSVALGFDQDTKDFKVLRISNSSNTLNLKLRNPSEKSVIEVYSVNKGCWYLCSNSVSHDIDFIDRFDHKACLNGIVHFIGRNSKHPIILAFKLVDDTIEEMKLAFTTAGLFTRLKTCIWNESLAFISSENYRECSMWVRTQCGSGNTWERKFTIRMLRPERYFKVLGFRNHGQIIEEIGSREGNGVLSSYDPQTRQTTRLGGGLEGKFGEFRVATFFESLALLDKQ